MLLAGDVGGTKTDLAIFSVEGGPHAPVTRFTHLMERIPIHLILNRAALVGWAAYGLESLKAES